jgi:hypothetical protein
MLATDPKEQARARPTTKCSGGRDVKTIPSRAHVRHQPRIESPREAARIFSTAASAQPIDHRPELHARTEFLYPTPSPAAGFTHLPWRAVLKVVRPLALVLVALGVLLAVVSARGSSQQTTGEIRGVVWAPECGSEPGVCRFVRVAGATVRACLVTRLGCTGVMHARAGRDGSYRLLITRPGHYRLTGTKRVQLGTYRPSPQDVLAGRGQVVRVELGKPG